MRSMKKIVRFFAAEASKDELRKKLRRSGQQHAYYKFGQVRSAFVSGYSGVECEPPIGWKFLNTA
jgi:hypothetical protein